MDVMMRIVRATVAGGEAREAGATVAVSAREAELLQRLGKAVVVVADGETATVTPNGETATVTPDGETATAPKRKRS